MVKRYYFVLSFAFLLGLSIFFIATLFDPTDIAYFYINREYYYLLKISQMLGAIFSIIFMFLSYMAYKMHSTEETIPALKTITTDSTCPICGSNNTIIQKDKLYCLNCGREVKIHVSKK